MEDIKNKIENLTKEQQLTIYYILKEEDIPFIINTNGLFLKYSDLTDSAINKIDNYIKILDNIK